MKVNNEKQERQEGGKTLYAGFEKLQLLAMNPDNKERAELYGIDYDSDKPEPEYIGTDKEGNAQVRIHCIFKGENTGKLFEKSWFINQKERIAKSGKKQYINQHGDFQFADVEDDLFQSFKHFTNVKKWNTEDGKYATGAKPADDGVEISGDKDYRVSYEGEESFYGFLKNAVSEFDKKNPDSTLLFDMKKFFKGNLSELFALLTSGETRVDPVVMLTVKTSNEGKQYQDMWTKFTLPAEFMRYINNDMKIPASYGRANTYNKYVKEIESEEGGCKQFYTLEPVREYDINEDGAAAPSAIVSDYSEHTEEDDQVKF